MQYNIVLRKGKRQRLELSSKDIEMLSFLERHRLLTLQQFYQVAVHLFDERMQEYSFKNRIRKFEDYYLIRSETYSDGFEGERFKYLCIGSKSIDLLIEKNLLDSAYNKSKIYKFNQKKNLMHFLATQQAVINILTKLDTKVIKDPNTNKRKYPIYYNITCFSHSPATFSYTEWIRKEKNLHQQNRGAYHARVAKHMQGNSSSGGIYGTTMTFVKPDWIIELKGAKGVNDANINIELDMGTESIETLAQKVFKYALLAEKNPEVLHIMDIVIADNSFSKRSKLSDGIGRTKNIIKRFNEDPAVIKRANESGLKIIVRPLKINVNQVYKILSKY